MRSVLRHLAMLCLVLPAAALAGTPNPELKAKAEKVIAQSAGAEGVWIAQDDGNIRHVQSGLTCFPGWPPLMPLTTAAVFPGTAGPGTDVGCDYEGLGAPAKLTIFAVKAKDGDTVDSALAAYRADILGLHKGAVSLGDTLGDAKTEPGRRTERKRLNMRTKRAENSAAICLWIWRRTGSWRSA